MVSFSAKLRLFWTATVSALRAARALTLGFADEGRGDLAVEVSPAPRHRVGGGCAGHAAILAAVHVVGLCKAAQPAPVLVALAVGDARRLVQPGEPGRHGLQLARNDLAWLGAGQRGGIEPDPVALVESGQQPSHVQVIGLDLWQVRRGVRGSGEAEEWVGWGGLGSHCKRCLV